MTDYFHTREEYGRSVRLLDIQAFARDLATAMGGKFIEPKPDDMGGRERYASFELDGCEVGLTRGWRNTEADKVTVRIGPLDCKLAYGETPSGAEYKLPDATVSATRPMVQLVADIRRRVIEPAKAPIAKRREYAAELKRRANSLAERADAFRKNPRLDVRVENGATHSGTLYSNGNGVYLNARFYADGTVSIDRIGSVDAETFEAILAVLYKDK